MYFLILFFIDVLFLKVLESLCFSPKTKNIKLLIVNNTLEMSKLYASSRRFATVPIKI